MTRPLAAVALCTALLAAGHAGAQEDQVPPPCAKLDRVASALAERFHEKPAAVGLQMDGRLLEIFASPDGATWTAVTTGPDGVACVAAIGKSWTTAGAEGPPA